MAPYLGSPGQTDSPQSCRKHSGTRGQLAGILAKTDSVLPGKREMDQEIREGKTEGQALTTGGDAGWSWWGGSSVRLGITGDPHPCKELSGLSPCAAQMGSLGVSLGQGFPGWPHTFPQPAQLCPD